MSNEDKILETLRKSGEPMSAGQLSDQTGMERKLVDKAMKTLKESGRIVSPKKCYWTVS